MKRRVGILLICCTFSLANVGYATCIDTLEYIRTDVIQHNNKPLIQPLTWMNLNWLNKQLGEPKRSTLQSVYHQWGNFSYYRSSDGTTQTMGKMPPGLRLKSPEAEFIRVLGKPTHTENKNYTQYTWDCQVGDTSSSLKVTMNEKNEISNIHEEICTKKLNTGVFDFNCKSFEANVSTNAITLKSLGSGRIANTPPQP